MSKGKSEVEPGDIYGSDTDIADIGCSNAGSIAVLHAEAKSSTDSLSTTRQTIELDEQLLLSSLEQWLISGEYPYTSAQQRNAYIKSRINAIDPSFQVLFVFAIVLPNIIISWLAQVGEGDSDEIAIVQIIQEVLSIVLVIIQLVLSIGYAYNKQQEQVAIENNQRVLLSYIKEFEAIFLQFAQKIDLQASERNFLRELTAELKLFAESYQSNTSDAGKLPFLWRVYSIPIWFLSLLGPGLMATALTSDYFTRIRAIRTTLNDAGILLSASMVLVRAGLRSYAAGQTRQANAKLERTIHTHLYNDMGALFALTAASLGFDNWQHYVVDWEQVVTVISHDSQGVQQAERRVRESLLQNFMDNEQINALKSFNTAILQAGKRLYSADNNQQVDYKDIFEFILTLLQGYQAISENLADIERNMLMPNGHSGISHPEHETGLRCRFQKAADGLETLIRAKMARGASQKGQDTPAQQQADIRELRRLHRDYQNTTQEQVSWLQAQIASLLRRVREQDEIIKRQSEKIRQQDETIRQQSETIRQQSETIRQQDEKIRQQDEKIRQQDEKIRQQDEKIRQQSETIEEQARTITQLRNELAEARQQRDKTREELERTQAKLKQTEAKLEMVEEELIAEKRKTKKLEDKVASLEERNDRLERKDAEHERRMDAFAAAFRQLGITIPPMESSSSSQIGTTDDTSPATTTFFAGIPSDTPTLAGRLQADDMVHTSGKVQRKNSSG